MDKIRCNDQKKLKIGSDQRPVIYSAIFGGYDNAPFEPTETQLERYRFVLFSDELKRANGWELVNISTDEPVLCNRKIKMFPWEYLDSRHSFYIDGHVSFGTNYAELFSSLIDGEDIFAVQQHRAGGNVGSELIRCIDNGKIKREHIQNFLDAGVDTTLQSVECGFIYRDAHSDLVRAHANTWWNYFNSKCPRDQLWIHHASIETGLEVKILDSSFNDCNGYLKVGSHKNKIVRILVGRLKKIKNIIYTGRLL